MRYRRFRRARRARQRPVAPGRARQYAGPQTATLYGRARRYRTRGLWDLRLPLAAPHVPQNARERRRTRQKAGPRTATLCNHVCVDIGLALLGMRARPYVRAASTEKPIRSGLQQLRIGAIELDGEVQSRIRHNPDAIREFSEAMVQGKPFPPVVVFYDGDRYWCGDGFHRVKAARRAKLTHVSAAVRKGGKRDAILHPVGANVAHGIRRTNADKRRAVLMLLRDPEWRHWSSREIARRAGVSHPFVESVRAGLTGNGYQSSTTRKSGDGRAIDTANTGASHASPGDDNPG